MKLNRIVECYKAVKRCSHVILSGRIDHPEQCSGGLFIIQIRTDPADKVTDAPKSLVIFGIPRRLQELWNHRLWYILNNQNDKNNYPLGEMQKMQKSENKKKKTPEISFFRASTLWCIVSQSLFFLTFKGEPQTKLEIIPQKQNTFFFPPENKTGVISLSVTEKAEQ